MFYIFLLHGWLHWELVMNRNVNTFSHSVLSTDPSGLSGFIFSLIPFFFLLLFPAQDLDFWRKISSCIFYDVIWFYGNWKWGYFMSSQIFFYHGCNVGGRIEQFVISVMWLRIEPGTCKYSAIPTKQFNSFSRYTLVWLTSSSSLAEALRWTGVSAWTFLINWLWTPEQLFKNYTLNQGRFCFYHYEEDGTLIGSQRHALASENSLTPNMHLPHFTLPTKHVYCNDGRTKIGVFINHNVNLNPGKVWTFRIVVLVEENSSNKLM